MPTLTEKQKQDRREASRRWRERNPETAKQRGRNNDYLRKYNISLEQYDEMLKAQQGVCAICATSCDTGMNLAVDHCHDTNKIRGLLCKNCNTAIGLFKEDVENMNKAINYIKFHAITEEIA
jgi:hypothetical protein